MEDNQRKVHKIVVDKNVCIGSATCVIIASKAFELDKNGRVEVMSTAMEHSDEQLLQAARSCPTRAIKLLDEQGNDISLLS
jgi:ferredoxin